MPPNCACATFQPCNDAWKLINISKININLFMYSAQIKIASGYND